MHLSEIPLPSGRAGRPASPGCPRGAPLILLALLAGLGLWPSWAAAVPLAFKAAASGLCMSVYNDSKANGAPIVQSACRATAGQQWDLIPTAGNFRLKTPLSGRCLEIEGDEFADGSAASQRNCKRTELSNDQQFEFRAYGAAYEIFARRSGKCLAVEGGSAQSGARIVQQTCDGSAAQQWLTRTDGVAGSQWSALTKLPLVPTAAAGLPNGKVMLWSSADRFSSGGDRGMTYTVLFDPKTLSFSEALVSNTGHEMFCSGTANLPDGRVMVTGGSSSQKASLYDARTGAWSAASAMTIPRGYQGSATTPGGKVLVYGGSWSGGIGGKTAEQWSEATAWQPVANLVDDAILTADARGLYRSDNHGWFFAAPGGRMLHAGPSRTMHWLGLDGSGTITVAGERGSADAMNGNAVMYGIGRLLVTGGAPSYDNSPATANATLIDINGAASVRAAAAMGYARTFHNSVVLPSGQVVVVGGQTVAVIFSDDRSVLTPELWDPRSESFTRLAPMAVPRVYHSVALLLPDGRVLSAGGGLCGTCTTNHPDFQILTPPYLLNPDGSAATRPGISSAPTSVGLGGSMLVTASGEIASFALVRLSSTTHSVNNEQRRVPLRSTSVGDLLYRLEVPSDAGAVVPGYYMLFAIGANGAPSVSTMVKVG